MKGALILLLVIFNIPVYKTIYKTFLAEVMEIDKTDRIEGLQLKQEFYNKSYGDMKFSLFIFLCVLAIMFEFFIIEGTISFIIFN
ncbi:hypothetical protein CPJCM30710_00620 [Clostridium polyendosporum]|uniref:Uncharacterized protein n=1 Tax=Clostridium polyendosporum TaxID=69208 RepID=A0A919RVY1_9CLOT|nr:hypothetical protein [Clostridium polyendosporum]GIM27396.1 hypothetical protein CPJCM30710_00620 [Clostridium polyendosporum]